MDKSRYYTYKLNMIVLNIFAIILFIIIGSIVFILECKDNYVIDFNFMLFILLMFLWMIIHEILHGIGFSMFKDVNKRNIVYGMAIERGVFYCMCKQNIGKRVILTSLFFPVIFIGLVTLIIGMVVNNFLLIYLSIINIVSSVGDIIMIIYFFKCPDDIIYLDLDDITSFTVVSKKDLRNIRVLGIELISTGIYDDREMVAKDYKKITITKFSRLILVVMILLGLLICVI